MCTQRLFRFLLPILLLASSAHATTYCVGTTQELSSALSIAGSSPTNDEIRIEAGTYISTGTLLYAGNPNFTKNLTVSGGWIDFVDPCGFQIPFVDATVIDGSATGKGFTFLLQGAVPGSLAVSNLTVRNTDTLSTTEIAGLSVKTSQAGNAPQVRISNVALLNGNSPSGSAGLDVFGPADVLVRSVLVADNIGLIVSGLAVRNNSTGPIVLNHVTVTDNEATLQYSGLFLNAAAPSTVSNAITSGNLSHFSFGDCDFASQNQNTTVTNAIINKLCSTVTPASSGIINVDPRFVVTEDGSPANYHLQGTSPAINAGVQNPIGGLTSFDLDGHDRSIGPKPDLGAYEAQDSLFKNGFDG